MKIEPLDLDELPEFGELTTYINGQWYNEEDLYKCDECETAFVELIELNHDDLCESCAEERPIKKRPEAVVFIMRTITAYCNSHQY